MNSILPVLGLVAILRSLRRFLKLGLWCQIDTSRRARLFLGLGCLSYLSCLCCLSFFSLPAAAQEEIVLLTTPKGSEQRYLYSPPTTTNALNKTAVLLFNGGAGVVGLHKGIPKPGANFLVRSRGLFAARGLQVALYDPSPDIGPMHDFDRMSERHRLEVAALIEDLRRRTGFEKIYFIGTSRGVTSAAYVGLHMGDGVVLTSSLFVAGGRNGYGLSGFDYSKLKKPLLFVHHVDDACPYTPYSEAKALSKTYPLITVIGGENFAGDPCEPWHAHGYRGREQATVDAIVDWISTGKVADPIQ
jgi:hypothetical protein